MSGLVCEDCRGKLHLAHVDKIIKLKNDSKVGLCNTPLLVCGGCQRRFIPYFTEEIITLFRSMLEDDIPDGEDTCKSENNMDNIEQWYDFSKIKVKFCNDKYIAEKVKFIYDKDDYYFIPGLVRPWKTGFLTPVFFKIEVLLKYIHHPTYGLDIGADTFGYVYKSAEHYISFGINENNKVIMWLGDIITLDIEEQFYLRSENIPSDHSISSEFYEAEIETTWANASAEGKLLKKRFDFNEKIRNNFGLNIAQLDTETVRIAKNIRKLLTNTNDAFKDLIIPLNELLVESINNKGIRNAIKSKNPEAKEKLKEKKGIKLLQMWLENNTEEIDINAEIGPLFVLYDLRLVSAHLYSDESREEMLIACCTRLGLSQDERNYITIANKLIEKLNEMYEKFNHSLKLPNIDEGSESSGE